jgi:GT2 family glycosyltransferase
MVARVTILIPNYKTPLLTTLCLRLIRKYTEPSIAKVIVIDNDSRDESLAYLKNLDWITLLERKSVPHESPALSHSGALDLALLQVDTPYVLSIHTDTLIKKAGWLEFLIAQLEASPQIAGVGSWKLEKKFWLMRWLKKVEHKLQSVYYDYIKKSSHVLEGVGENFYYLRSHCALYRMDLIKQFGLTFSESEHGVHAGKTLHKKLVDNGYEMVFLPSDSLLNYLDHINHATMVLNPNLGSKTQSIKKGLKRIEKRLAKFHAQKILMDASLDL